MLKCNRNVRNNVHWLTIYHTEIPHKEFPEILGFKYYKFWCCSNRDKIFVALKFWFVWALLMLNCNRNVRNNVNLLKNYHTGIPHKEFLEILEF